jgi:multidrug efflux pump subunit AcrA (membrane-fusion protein)
MNAILRFIRHHVWTLLLLFGCIGIAVWVVKTQRSPGSMTIIEAQAMDMTTSKPPTGVQPVAVDIATMREVGSAQSYPATLAALSDEEVMARVPGRLSKVLVYNGDTVHPGQLLATLEASEYSAQAGEADYMASSKLAMATSAMREIKESQAMLRKADAMIKVSASNLQRMQIEFESAKSEHEKTQSELSMSNADVRDREADAKYASQNLEREKKLYKAGAISLDELQMATKDSDGAQARLRSARAAVRAKEQDVEIAHKRIDGAKAGVNEARSMVASSKAERDQANSALAKAKQNAKASKLEAKASKSAAAGMSAIADYRNLRASTNGVVSERVASPGSVVMAGQVILRIKDTTKLRVQADLPQSLFGKVSVGSRVVINTDSTSHDASITSVTPSVDSETRTFRIEALVNNSDQKMAPGMFAKLSVKMGSSESKLAVKSTAVQIDAEGKNYVWTLSEKAGDGKPTDWTCTMHPQVSENGPGLCPICKMDLVPRTRSGKFVAEKRPVTIGAADGTYTAIESGLKEGEKVIWAGMENLQPGTAIFESEWGENGPVDLPSTEGDMKGMPGMEKTSGTSHSQASEPINKPKPSQSKAQSPHRFAYICPMKCKGSESDKPGICPVCKMHLVTVASLEGKK